MVGDKRTKTVPYLINPLYLRPTLCQCVYHSTLYIFPTHSYIPKIWDVKIKAGCDDETRWHESKKCERPCLLVRSTFHVGLGTLDLWVRDLTNLCCWGWEGFSSFSSTPVDLMISHNVKDQDDHKLVSDCSTCRYKNRGRKVSKDETYKRALSQNVSNCDL